MNEIVLSGCAPTPLANYLKALGVLRILGAKHPETRGFWRGNRFVLRTPLDQREVTSYFLNDYEPTPVIAPWNGGSGFYFQERKSDEKDPLTGKKKKLGVFDQETTATKVVDAILGGSNARFDRYREALRAAKDFVKAAGFFTAPKEESKERFILLLRANLPESCLEAMDACLSIGMEQSGSLKADWPPLLGTGGNDGNLDFTSNFMQRLDDVLGTADGSVPDQSVDWLNASLFDVAAPCLTKSKLGQFSPVHAGGVNAVSGFDADAAINPWSFVLMIEGALMFAAALVRRSADDVAGVLSFPFTVRAVSAGAGHLAEGDTARGELWMPLWEQPASCAEISSLMREGRVALGKRPARDALDFVRALHHLGGYRGVRSFQRFGILKRNGDAHFATPLMRVEVNDDPVPAFIDEFDRHGWLDRLRQFASGDATATRFLILRRQLEDRLFDLSGHEPAPAEMQSLLILLGQIQHALAVSTKARAHVPPIPRLSERWVMAADDGTPEFRIAKALAGLQGVGSVLLPLRAQLFPVDPKLPQWITPKSDEQARLHIDRTGRLPSTLIACLTRRLRLVHELGMTDKPLSSVAGAQLDDVAAFFEDGRMDARIAALLPGLSLCEIPRDVDRAPGDGTVPAAFGLMKLALTPDRVLRDLGCLGQDEHLPIPEGMLARLAAGNHGNQGVTIAWRRLRAHGLTLSFAGRVPGLVGIEPARAAAALLIPLRPSATAALARALLQAPQM